MSYEALKAKAFVGTLKGKPRLTKALFKELAFDLKDQLDLKPADFSQLWELAEPDDRGEVNKSYVEEMLDMIHLQREEQLDGRFDLVNGLKFVNQEVFHQETTRSAAVEEIRSLVQRSFENGHGLIMEKIESIAKKGRIDRVELAELIDSLEHQQLYAGTNLDNTIDQIVMQPATSGSEAGNEEYSEERAKELSSIIKMKLETACKESDRVKASLTVVYFK